MICNALIPFLLASIKWITRYQSRSGLFVFSKMVSTRIEKRYPVEPPGAHCVHCQCQLREGRSYTAGLPQRGQQTPFGQRRPCKYILQASSFGNIASNSEAVS